jgi:GT2 family glycosyltransferase
MNLSAYISDIASKSQLNTVANSDQRKFYCEIIVPVYNGFRALKKCISSLLLYTNKHHKIHIVNDASTDIRVKPWLNAIASDHAQIRITHRNSNLGYLHNVNLAMQASKHDVVLLNSDTEVTKNWLEELAVIADDKNIAIVCPLSNNATILTLDSTYLDNIHNLSDFTGRWYAIPTAVGSCMLIKCDIINNYGVFDAYYDPGYGEECDYSLVLRNAGYDIACAPASFVYHKGSESFGEDAILLKQQHQALLDLRWPHYSKEIQHFLENNPIKNIEEFLQAKFDPTKTHVLHVIHGFGQTGGTELFTRDLLQKSPRGNNHTVLHPCRENISGQTTITEQISQNIRILKYQFNNRTAHMQIAHMNADLLHQELDVFFSRIVYNGKYKLVHFHSMVGIGSLIWPLLCHHFRIPYIISCHDHFPVCFNYSMLTAKNTEYCQKSQCSQNDSFCIKCLNNLTNFSHFFVFCLYFLLLNVFIEVVIGLQGETHRSESSKDFFHFLCPLSLVRTL